MRSGLLWLTRNVSKPKQWFILFIVLVNHKNALNIIDWKITKRSFGLISGNSYPETMNLNLPHFSSMQCIQKKKPLLCKIIWFRISWYFITCSWLIRISFLWKENKISQLRYSLRKRQVPITKNENKEAFLFLMKMKNWCRWETFCWEMIKYYVVRNLNFESWHFNRLVKFCITYC